MSDINSVFAQMAQRRASAKLHEEEEAKKAAEVEAIVEEVEEKEEEDKEAESSTEAPAEEAPAEEAPTEEEMDPEIVKAMEEEGLEISKENYDAIVEACKSCKEEKKKEKCPACKEDPCVCKKDEEEGPEEVDEGGGSRRTKAARQYAAQHATLNRELRKHGDSADMVGDDGTGTKSVDVKTFKGKYANADRRGKVWTYEEAAEWLESNGYVVDEESIEALLNDWTVEAEVQEENADKTPSSPDVVAAGKKPSITQVQVSGGAAKNADKTPNSPDVVEAGKKQSFSNSQVSGGAAKNADNESGKHDTVEAGKKPSISYTEAAMKLREEYEVSEEDALHIAKLILGEMEEEVEEAAEAPVQEEVDTAELLCRLEECGGSDYMKNALAEGKIELVSRYLSIKEG